MSLASETVSSTSTTHFPRQDKTTQLIPTAVSRYRRFHRSLSMKDAEPWRHRINARTFFLRALSFLVLCVSVSTYFLLFMQVYQAFRVNPSVLGIPVSSASNLSYALRIASIPAAYFKTSTFSSSFCGTCGILS